MSPKRELLHEWMHRFEYGYGFVVRVWTERTVNHLDEFNAQREKLQDILDHADTDEIEPRVVTLAFVNAVEVLDKSGNGRLVYVDWP